MQHLVRFTTAEGRDGSHTADSLDDALKFVERLRNTEEASEVRVFRLHEVPISFRAYYRVEVGAVEGEEESVVPAPPAVPAPEATEPAKPGAAVVSAPEAAGDSANGRRIFAR